LSEQFQQATRRKPNSRGMPAYRNGNSSVTFFSRPLMGFG
jgi:hypothetical protein